METKTLTFRKAAASDLDAVTAIYDRLHAQEDAGRVTIGWVTGVYPIRFDAEQALARGRVQAQLLVPYARGDVAAFIHKYGIVAAESYQDQGTLFDFSMDRISFGRVTKMLEG